jgi:ABC-type branched-subunit amino acid transport system substrate-binding protein
MKKLNLLAAVVIVLSLILAGCGGPAGPTEVKMGALVPLTGALSEFGEGFRKAGDLAVAQLEEAGVAIDFVYADTETSAMPGVDAARNLVDVENVVALIGAASSGVTMPIAESVSIPSEVPQISNASTNPLMSNLPSDEGKDFLFRTCPSDALQGVVLGKLAADEGYQTASVLYVNNPYGEGLAEVFQEAFEAQGGQVLSLVPHDETPAPTYVTELNQVMDGEPDVMVALGYPGQATVYLKEFFEAGYNETTDLLFVDGTKSTEMPAELGADLLAGYFGTAPGTVGGEPLEIFQADYEAEYGELPPLPFMSNFYDAVIVAGLAAAACDAKDMDITPTCVRDHLREVGNPPGETITPGVESLTNAIELLNDGQAINYEGAAGAVDFDENGDVVTPIEVWKYVAEEPYIESVRMEEVE